MLDHQRREEKATGTIRYLCPAYQAPGQQLMSLSLAPKAVAVLTTTATGRLPWPAELAQRMQAVRAIILEAPAPLSSAQLAACFKGSSTSKVQPLLGTLTALALVRFVAESQAMQHRREGAVPMTAAPAKRMNKSGHRLVKCGHAWGNRSE